MYRQYSGWVGAGLAPLVSGLNQTGGRMLVTARCVETAAHLAVSLLMAVLRGECLGASLHPAGCCLSGTPASTTV